MRAKVAISRDSALYFAACQRRRARTMDSRIVDQSATVSTPSEESAGGAMSFADLSRKWFILERKRETERLPVLTRSFSFQFLKIFL